MGRGTGGAARLPALAPERRWPEDLVDIRASGIHIIKGQETSYRVARATFDGAEYVRISDDSSRHSVEICPARLDLAAVPAGEDDTYPSADLRRIAAVLDRTSSFSPAPTALEPDRFVSPGMFAVRGPGLKAVAVVPDADIGRRSFVRMRETRYGDSDTLVSGPECLNCQTRRCLHRALVRRVQGKLLDALNTTLEGAAQPPSVTPGKGMRGGYGVLFSTNIGPFQVRGEGWLREGRQAPLLDLIVRWPAYRLDLTAWHYDLFVRGPRCDRENDRTGCPHDRLLRALRANSVVERSLRRVRLDADAR